MSTIDFNKLSLEDKCKVVQSFGNFVCCRGTEGDTTINVYSLRSFFVEMAIHNVLNTIQSAKAKTL